MRRGWLAVLFSPPTQVAFSWLIALVFWTAVSIGALLLVMIHHVFDAGWSTVIRRMYEHWFAVFPWLAGLFLPLVVGSFMYPGLLWKWTDKAAVAHDIIWVKKSGFLNPVAFTVFMVVFFGVWIWLSSNLRKHSFAQDDDGDIRHTFMNRRFAAGGIPLTALTLTFAAFYWMMSLEYHWFSTMYGVWYFASSIRAALAFFTLVCLYLSGRGVLKGIFSKAQMLHAGNLMLAFTVFWAYICFSQYFLIWNGNVPEETFWFNLREVNPSTGLHNSWWPVGLTLLFGYFLVPFLFLLQNPLKKKAGSMTFICVWILAMQLLDFFFNILPGQKLANGDPVPFGISPWDVTAFIGVGGICLWVFFNSMTRARCIPIRDPRIVESLHCHE